MWKKANPGPLQYEQPVSSRNPVDELKEHALIGSSLLIRGDLSGGEDIVIQGQVEGTVDLRKHNVTIGRNGRIKADICGKTISVEGEVQGNLVGLEKVVIRESGKVQGNIRAPRVHLEDGSRFKGSIDMAPNPQGKQRELSEVITPARVEDRERNRKISLGSKTQKAPSQAS